MPKINPDDYYDGTDDFDIDYTEDYYDGDECEHTIGIKDLDTATELVVWKKIRKWGNPYLHQYWDKEHGMLFQGKLFFNNGRIIELEAEGETVEIALVKLLDKVKEAVFEICNS